MAEATAGWDLDWRQLDGGSLEASLLRVSGGDATFERVAFNRRFAQRGSSPSGRLTLGLIEKNVGEIGWCGKNVSSDDLLVFSPGGDNECVSRPGFRGHLVSYTEEHLERIATDLELSVDLGLYRNGGIALPLDPNTAENLRRHLRRLDRVVTGVSTEPAGRWFRRQLESEIATRLLYFFAANPPKRCERVDGFKARAARMAREFIDSRAHEKPAIRDVCAATGVSWRTLDYAFCDLFGVTPKQYLQATRLDGVRKELHQKGPSAKITDVANDWGFWHMGQFAADYKRLFGELPSETLRRTNFPNGES